MCGKAQGKQNIAAKGGEITAKTRTKKKKPKKNPMICPVEFSAGNEYLQILSVLRKAHFLITFTITSISTTLEEIPEAILEDSIAYCQGK